MNPIETIAPATLIDRERVRGAARVIAEGTPLAQITPEQIAQVAADVELFVQHHKLSRKDVAKAIGYSPGVVSEFCAGHYAGNVAQVAMDLEAWLVEEEHRRTRPQTTQFVWTNAALEMKAVANYCLDKRTIGMVYGPESSGVGKTTSLLAIQRELGPRRCSLVTIDKVDANPSGLLHKISTALRIGDGGCTRVKFNRIVQKLSGRSHLLLIDQIHNLRGARDDRPFYVLADLFDATKTAQLWVGTADLVVYLDRQRRKNQDESLAQIRRRVFPCVDLMASARGNGTDGGGQPLVTVEQVREMFAQNKLKLTGDAVRFLAALANQPDSGSIGLCVQLVDYARTMAELRGRHSIDKADLLQALKHGFAPQRAQALLAELSDGREASNAAQVKAG